MKIWSVIAPLFGASIFLVDRLTKIYFYSHPRVIKTLVPDWLWLQLYVNQDMALSLPLFPVLYYGLTALVLLALLARLAYAATKALVFEYIIIIVIVSAAISNLIDRFYYGGVVDFIHLRFGSIFNLADIAIVIAIGWWIGVMFYHEQHARQKQRSKIST